MFAIHPTIRLDLLELFFRTPAFSFFTAASCLAFLRMAASHTHLITTLTLYLRSTETGLLELICKELLNRKAPLRHLNIHLENNGTFYGHGKRVETAYMIPRRIGLSEKGQRAKDEGILQARQGNYEYREIAHEHYGLRLGYRDYYEYKSEHLATAVEAARSHDAFLSKLDTLRYLVVRGQPENVGVWDFIEVKRNKAGEAVVQEKTGKIWQAIDFELAILKLHLKMQVVADREGKKLRMEGSEDHEDFRWYYEAFIDGEELDAPRYW